jgi:hypothetical protein
MMFIEHPLKRLREVAGHTATAIRTLPDSQLRAERDTLRAEGCGDEIGPERLMLALLDAEVGRRKGAAK